MLPSEKFKLAQATSYVFHYVNPPWGKTDPNAMATWGYDNVYEVMYLAPDGSRKGFTLMETITDTNTPSKAGTIKTDQMLFTLMAAKEFP